MTNATLIENSPARQIIRPFDAGGWFAINNAVFDEIMPRLSPNGWKVLCVAIRQTWGWVAEVGGDPRERREWDWISYSQFMEKTGISGKGTVRRAIQECLEKMFLIRRQVGMFRGQPKFEYALNKGYEIPTGTEIVPVNGLTGTKTVPVTGTKTVPVNGLTGTKIVPTKQTTNKQQTNTPAVVDSHVETLLTNEGVNEPALSELTATCTPALVEACLNYRKQNPGLGLGWLVTQLRTGSPPNDGRSAEAERSSSSISGLPVYSPETR